MKSRTAIIRLTLPCLLLVAVLALAKSDGKPLTVKGYVLDSACAFTKGLSKPISKDCAEACAKAGSPLVILSDDGIIYWPIAETTPSSGQNEKHRKTGTAFQRQIITHCSIRALIHISVKEYSRACVVDPLLGVDNSHDSIQLVAA